MKWWYAMSEAEVTQIAGALLGAILAIFLSMVHQIIKTEN